MLASGLMEDGTVVEFDVPLVVGALGLATTVPSAEEVGALPKMISTSS